MRRAVRVVDVVDVCFVVVGMADLVGLHCLNVSKGPSSREFGSKPSVKAGHQLSCQTCQAEQ